MVRRRLFLFVAFGVLAYVSCVPFYYLQPVVLTSGLPPFQAARYLPFFLVLLLVLIVGVSPWRLLLHDTGLRAPALAIAAYLLVGLLSLTDAEHVTVGFAKWVYYGATGSLFGLCLALGTASWSVVSRLSQAVVALAGVVALYTVVVSLLGWDPVWGRVHAAYNPYYSQTRAVGPFGNPVSTATYLVLSLPWMAWMAATGSTWQWRAIGMVLLITALLAVLLTQTRASAVASVVALLISLPLLRRAWMRPPVRARQGLALLVVVTLVGVGAIQLPHLQEAAERWRHLLSPQEVTITRGDRTYHYGSLLEYTERFRVAQYFTTLNVLRDHPMLGVGFGNFTRVFPRYRYSENYELGDLAIHTTDNQYLMALAETGVFGLLATGSLIVVLAHTAWRRRRQLYPGPARDLLLAFLASMGALSLLMLAWDLLNDPTVRILFWALAGLAMATVRQEEPAYQAKAVSA